LTLRMHLPDDRVLVIPHGNKDVPYLPPPGGEHIHLLFFGFLYPGKGIEDLIEAFALARQQSPAVRQHLRLSIAGGSQPTMLLKTRGDYVTELREKLRAASLEDCSEVITDIPEDTVPDLFQRHHALVLPYRDSRKINLLGRFLGASGPLAWAIACGRGALVSDARALAEEVASGNGTVFRQRDTKDLAASLINIADDPEIVVRWSEAARKLAQERTWRVTGQRFARLFDEVCRQPV
ncbi:MAG TPA: glycosyltransferase, partial [Gammaproteobacteria bacterium]|nr:glycosyltransferase [Gammaproteobacteria bacterium]